MATAISEETAQFLVTDAGQAILEQVPTLGSDAAAQVLGLRKRGIAPEIAAGAVEVASARRRARARFADADRLFFTSDALAQATSPGIAAYHADCLAPLGTVMEWGCGIGMDTVQFAQAGLSVLASERDPARLVFARANAHVRGVADQVAFQLTALSDDSTSADDEEGDDAEPAPPDSALTHRLARGVMSGQAGLYADPSRREGDRRTSHNADRYDPPLPLIAGAGFWLAGGCVKLSPALPDADLDEFARSFNPFEQSAPARIEFLSEGRECKEACILWGKARGAGEDLLRAAVLLPERLAIAADQPAPLAPSLPAPGSYALDPDPALVRANALGAVAGASLISPDDAYLTSDAPPAVPRLASAYRIEAILPYQPRRVGQWLKTEGYGRLVVKKRHFPKEPDQVARDVKLPGTGREITLILVRTGASHVAVLCHPAPPAVQSPAAPNP